MGENTPVHDAQEIATGRMVQIKSTFKGYCYYPHGEDRIPEYLLSIQILETGEIVEIYNGPGKFIYEKYILNNKLTPYRNSYYTLSKGILQKMNEEVTIADKIKIV